MNKIEVHHFGKIKSSEYQILAAYYQKLISKYYSIRLVTHKDVGEKSITARDLPQTENLIILDDAGKSFETKTFASFVAQKIVDFPTINFVVGNAYGFAAEVKQRFQTLSLSPMTLAHELTIVVLLEQLYRVFNLQAGGKYHK